MVKNNNKGTTLDDLANMVATGFDSVDKKIENIERRMVDKDEFNLRFNTLEKKVDKLDYQMSEVYDILKRFEENDILNLQKRVQTLEKVVKALANQISSK